MALLVQLLRGLLREPELVGWELSDPGYHLLCPGTQASKSTGQTSVLTQLPPSSLALGSPQCPGSSCP